MTTVNAKQLEEALTRAYRMGAASVKAPDLIGYIQAEFAGFVLDQCSQAERAPLPKGWTFNHTQQQTDEDGPVDGVWEIGFLDPEDDRFSPIVTVDTGLYYQDKQAEPLARAILARLAA